MGSPVTRCAVISCLVAIVVIAVFFTFRYIQKSSESNKEWEKSHRLPESIIPSHYSVLLHPNLVTKIFHGQNNITFNITEPRSSIIIHSKDLNISETQLFDYNGQAIPLEETFEYPDNEFWVIVTQTKLEVGQYYLNLLFKGNLTGKIIGFYSSKYVAPNGTKRTIATSKFEPTYARQAFPCFDEPNFKAEFTIKLVRPSENNYIALSNMNQVAEYPDQPQAGLTTVEFARSVPMPTYLACFIVCDFDHLEPVKAKDGFPITVYARPGEAKNMQHSLELAVKTINFYTEYFDIKYPLPKLDLIAIPDFVSGAMEHWGLVTFRETQSLFNEKSSSLSNKRHISLTVAHELAHMWFGNLVTMAWWNDLWLNEGFASYMEFKGVAHSYPDWDMDSQLLIDDTHRVLTLDSSLSSHPIVQTVSHPDQITEIFDTISYSKGPSIIRMLENMIGPETFRRGVSNYLKKFAYKNAETEDLWSALDNEFKGEISISKVMGTWTNQMGYPLIDVVRSGDTLTITQQRCLALINSTFDENESEFHYKWDIPLTYVTSSNSSSVGRSWLLINQSSAIIDLPPNTDWVKLNYHQYGYYRVRYASEDWNKLVKMLEQNPNVISAADRANLLDDAFSLAKSGYTNYKPVLDILPYLKNENHFFPLIVVSQKLQFLQNILSNTRVYPKFRKYIHNILDPLINDSLWDISSKSTYLERRKKLVTLELGCSLKVPSCVRQAVGKFQDWLLRNGTKPDPELRNLVYQTGMSYGGETEWEKLWQAYLNEQEPQEKSKLRSALTTVKEPWILNRYMDLAKDENYIRSQDYIFLLMGIADNPVGTPIIWDFVRDQWDYLVKRFTLNNRNLGQLIPRITSSFSTKTKLNELKLFLNANPEAGAGVAGRKLAVEKIENNIRWIANNLPHFLSLF